MNIDLSRVRSGVPVLYAPHPGFIKIKQQPRTPSYLSKPEEDEEQDGPLVMTGYSEYFGEGADDLWVEVFGGTKPHPEKQKFFLKLSELIMVH